MAAKKTTTVKAEETKAPEARTRNRVTDATKGGIKAAHSEGLNNREIASKVGVCPQTVTKVLEEFGLKTNGKPGRKPQVKAMSSEPKAVA